MPTTLEKLEATDIGETVSAVTWAENSHIELANGDIYSFKERPYLIDPLRTLARLVCARKARGLGFSETKIFRSIHGLGKGRFRQGVQYVFPTETAMREFVQSRFNVVIKKNAILRKMVQDTDTTYYKRVGSGNLFMNGGGLTTNIEGLQSETMTFRSKQTDMAVIDELDMFDGANDVVASALTSMMNSPTKAIDCISNPSIPNYGIDKLFQMSNQMFWYRECKSGLCTALTCADKEFPDLIDKEGCHCHKCGSLLIWRGMWIPDYPKRNDLYGTESKDWEGYHISDLQNPNTKPITILDAYSDKSDSNQEKVHKFQLGLPFMPRTNRLTLMEVYDCCGYQPEYEKCSEPTVMGVDVGSSSGFHVGIGVRTGKDTYQLYRVDRLETFEDVILLGHRFNVKNCVCDMLPETTAARKFQKDANFRVWLSLYNTTNPVDEVTWDQDSQIVKIFRNYIFDTSHRVVAEKRVKFPRRSRKMEEFAKQYTVPVKIQDVKKQGNIFKYFSPSSDDHYRNMMNYFLVAATHSRITRPEGTRRKVSNKAVHETVRI